METIILKKTSFIKIGDVAMRPKIFSYIREKNIISEAFCDGGSAETHLILVIWMGDKPPLLLPHLAASRRFCLSS